MIAVALRWAGLALLGALVVLLVLLFKPVPAEIAPIRPRAATQYWTMPGGYRIAYTHLPRKQGGPPRPPVVFLHGGPGGYIHSSIIRALQPIADGGRDIYLYDQSGTGLSDRRDRPGDTSIASHLVDLEWIRKRLGAEKIALIGHSFGGLLAALYATDHPHRIERLVLSSPGHLWPERFDEDGTPSAERRYPVPAAYRFTPPAGYAAATSASKLPLRALLSFTLAQLLDVKFAPDAEMDAAINTLARDFTRTMVCDPANVQPEEGGAGAYSRIGTNSVPDGFVDRRPAMPHMRAPVLVLQGQCDFLSYADAFEYAALFPKGSYRFVPGAGHILWWDRPHEYSALIGAFLEGRTVPPTAVAP